MNRFKRIQTEKSMVKFLFNQIQTETKHAEIHLTDCEIHTLLYPVYPHLPFEKVITPNELLKLK